MEWAEPKCLLSLSWDIHWGGPWISGSHYIRFLCIAWRVASVCILHKFRLPTALLFMSAVLQPCKNIYLLCIWHQEFSSVQFSSSVVSDSLQPHELQHARPPCPSPTPRVYPNLCPLSQWCHPNISSSVVTSPPVFNLSQHQGLFKWLSFLHQVAKVLEFQLQHQSF